MYRINGAFSQLKTRAFSNHTFPNPKPNTTQLTELIKHSILVDGSVTISDYMKICLQHPIFGYYASCQRKESSKKSAKGDKDSQISDNFSIGDGNGYGSQVFGRKGDFITAPEISQIFGELVGVWAYSIINQMNYKRELEVIELGPGRGTLMNDFLNSYNQLDRLRQHSNPIKNIKLVEISPYLQDLQKRKLKNHPQTMEFLGHVSDLNFDCEKTNLVLANEFFDAMPVHRFKKTENGWREILIDLDEDPNTNSHFRFVLAKRPTQGNLICRVDEFYKDYELGSEIEVSPDSWSVLQQLFKKIGKNGIILISDYGQDKSTPSETLRAIKDHKFVDVFQHLGESDLSIDVDFTALKRFVPDDYVALGPISQRDFLLKMGGELRLNKLIQLCRNQEEAEELRKSFERLVKTDEMGLLYKVMAIVPKEMANKAYPFY